MLEDKYNFISDYFTKETLGFLGEYSDRDSSNSNTNEVNDGLFDGNSRSS